MITPDVIIVGSGLAGMTAAVELSEAGKKVLVLEANPFIGGRTSSWIEQGMPVESGLHRFLGFYTALPATLKKVGIDLDEMLTWEDEVEIRTRDGIHSTFGAAPLHKPFKTIWNVFGHNNFVSPGDKLNLGIMIAKGMEAYVEHPDELDKITVADFAKKHDVSDQAIERVLTPATEGIFFVPPERYSMYNLMGLIVPYLNTTPKTRVGAFNGGMSEVMMQPMADYIAQHGGEVRTNAPVDALLVADGTVTGVWSKGAQLQAKQVILAASLHSAQCILKESSLDKEDAFKDMLALDTMPAVTFQMELTKPSMDIDRTTFGPKTVLASFAEQSRTTFKGTLGRLSVILAEPEKYKDMQPDKILAVVKKDARALGISLDGIIKDYRKIIWHHDFYSLEPGHEAMRPSQQTPVPGLTLAGDYTKQQYLATMEGACVSGKIAADIVLGRQE